MEHDHHRDKTPSASSPRPGTDRRFSIVVALVNFWPGVLALAALSVVESMVTARVGMIAGSFYKLVVDDEPSELLGAMSRAVILYLGCAATAACSMWLAGLLSVRWRRSLSSELHHRYYTNTSRLLDTSKDMDNPDQRATTEVGALCEALASVVRLAAGAPLRVLFYSWLASGYVGWKGVAAATAFFVGSVALQRLASLPYARRVFVQERWEGNLRFSALRVRERAAEIAACRGGDAEKQHADRVLDGTLRNQASMVFWRAALVATTKGVDYGGALLNYVLVAAVVFSSQDTSSGGSTAEFVSNASFYTLALIYSYTELLDLAETVARATAYTDRVGELLESLSSMCNDDRSSSTMVENVVEEERGRSAVDGWLRGTMASCASVLMPRARSSGYLKGNRQREEVSSVREMDSSKFGTLVLCPTRFKFLDSRIFMETSVHALAPDFEQEALNVFPEIAMLHGDCNDGNMRTGSRKGKRTPPILCCMTFQFFASGTMDLLKVAPGPTQLFDAGKERTDADAWLQSRSNLIHMNRDTTNATLSPPLRRIEEASGTVDARHAAEMDRLLDNFVRWYNAVSNEISRRDQGYWCHAVDPRTGRALTGKTGEVWSEVAAAHAFLKYDKVYDGPCPVIVHPRYGTSAYPASVFTNAPSDVFLEVLQTLGTVHSAIESHDPTRADCTVVPKIASEIPPLLRVTSLTLTTPDGRRTLIRNLSFSVQSGKHMLIHGPNGVGKSTLLKALAGIHRPVGGNIAWRMENGRTGDPFAFADDREASSESSSARTVPCSPFAMFLPQRPLAAPGPCLWQQMVYPSTLRPTDAVLRSLLISCGLEHLLVRTNGSFDEPLAHSSCENSLSVGELQRLGFIRVLVNRPRIVLLDEPTAAMDDASAGRLFLLLHEAGITCLTVGQNTKCLRDLHDFVAELGEK